MIRDPSDGSERPDPAISDFKPRPTSAENWGLKSLDKPERKPKPAPTIPELEAHYREFGLGFMRKEQWQ